MRLILQQPESVIQETWQWETDVILSDNGTEQRIMLSSLPRRGLSEALVFDAVDDVRAIMTTLAIGIKDVLLVPFWQYAVRIDASAGIGATALTFKRHRAEVRQGQNAVLIKRDGTAEPVVLATLTGGGCTLAAPLTAVAPAGAKLVPCWPMYAAGSVSLTRNNPDNAGVLQLNVSDTEFMNPFNDPDYAATLTMFAGLPVLEQRPTGNSFETGSDTGATWTNYGGVAEVRDRWKHTQLVFPVSFLCNRVLEYHNWEFWRTFADYTKGSLNPFWISSNREDFDLHTAPAPSGATLAFTGYDYADVFFPSDPFKALVISTAAGLHYATVTGVSKVAGNTVVTFTPALPSDSMWSQEQKVSLLMKVRISDDKFALNHFALQTMVNINLRTVDA